MARRSLQASIIGIEKAKRAFKRTGWTQEDLACEVGIETRQPVWKFFTGKPIERRVFLEICFRLDLDWQEIAILPMDDTSIVTEEQDNQSNIDTLLQIVRSRRYNRIQTQCGVVRLLDTAQPVELNDICVSAEVVDKTNQRWLDASQLHCLHVEELNRYSCSPAYQKRIPAMQAVATSSKLMILGKPGAGKSMLLRQIAIKCNRGELLANRFPFFIRLQNFAEDASEFQNYNLLDYISHELGKIDISVQQVETLLDSGKALVLLDGLDEVPEEDRVEVQKQIRKFSEKYDKNHFIITCRIAAQQYWFEEFTDVEIADFSFPQIEAFTQKWFVNANNSFRQEGSTLATQFIQKLLSPENQPIRELAKTPLLLHLICSMFQAGLDFSAKRSKIYKQALDVLLVRWDEVRGINRDRSFYYQLPLLHKIKLLSQIAIITFEQGHYFFTQCNILRYIKDYLRSLPNTPADLEELQLMSEAVLRSLLAQHGILVEQAQEIYSFSHLTFQEYLTARNIVASFEPEELNKNLMQLTVHMSKAHWHEVFLLTVEMLADADALMQSIQRYSDELMAVDEKLQQFLTWVHQKSLAVEAPYQSAAIRAFYLTLDLCSEVSLARDLSLALAIEPNLAGNLPPDLALDLAVIRTLSLILALPNEPSWEQVLALNSALPHDLAFICHSKLQLLLQELKNQISTFNQDEDALKEWWSTQVNQLKFQIIWYRNVGYQWRFNEQQKELLQQYYAIQHLLLYCLRNSCAVSSAVRQQIEKTLLLPLTKSSNLLESPKSKCLKLGLF
ncbi:NACHT domain-containing protein [Gloeocapsopsis dulcis]|uniref:Histidine kinase n=1 Tax=Gloeocapsopsis dulcis AAB1 = 1H9 TaxID=1433147 RepID=A0A6N8G2C7_9CHRO|nr:NACHT domain-containing NTPase [Gloeocapsopsis dulcis]MUL38755.1 histidine kinase [Gloeocapsopsis dulcis AAB1 = 1H9]WNN91669.1 NACHT domain-containing NTPase [Gloeocapsopsis dulcis]